MNTDILDGMRLTGSWHDVHLYITRQVKSRPRWNTVGLQFQVVGVSILKVGQAAISCWSPDQTCWFILIKALEHNMLEQGLQEHVKRDGLEQLLGFCGRGKFCWSFGWL